jgi:hypothetical protein
MSASGDISFTISGLGGISESAVSGISIYYGVNMIPHANLELNVKKVEEQEPGLLCSPDKYKSKSKIVIIRVKTKTGCIEFRGFLDGISFSQSVGGVSYTAVLKSSFQSLVEVYPRALGLMPGSFAPYKAVDLVETNNQPFAALNRITVGGVNLDPAKPVAEYLSKLIQAIVKSQTNVTLNISAKDPHYKEILEHKVYKQNLKTALEFVDTRLDVEATKKCGITGANCGEWLFQLSHGDFPTLWDMMISMYAEINCVLVCGNRKLFVLPKAQFLKIQNHGTPPQGGTALKPNRANPADFNYLTISDNGYSNIRYCLNVIDPSSYAPYDITGFIRDKPGRYIATDAEVADSAAGLYTNRLSVFALNSLVYGSPNASMQSNGPFAHSAKVPADAEQVRDAVQESLKAEEETHGMLVQSKKLDNFAKIAFLAAKFEDRSGSFTTVFNPNWVPGSTASVYTRIPGLFFQGYVTNVVHEVKLNIPNELKVVTTVSMNCIRQASSASQMQGVTDDGFFNYTSSDMGNYWNRWLSDVAK